MLDITIVNNHIQATGLAITPERQKIIFTKIEKTKDAKANVFLILSL